MTISMSRISRTQNNYWHHSNITELSYLFSISTLVMAGRNLSKWMYPVWSSSTWSTKTTLLGFWSLTSPRFFNLTPVTLILQLTMNCLTEIG